METLKVVIVGAGRGGTAILKGLLPLQNVQVLGIADINPQAPGMILARERGLFTTCDYLRLIRDLQSDVIIEATGVPEVQKKIMRIKKADTSLMDAQAANLMMRLVSKQEELLGVKELQEQLGAILNAAQEGIQMVDSRGTILYTNKSFSEITKIPKSERIGKSIFDVSPQGALAEVLRTNKPVFGKFNVIEGSGVEVLSNASPIMVDGQMVGAVTVFRDISDIKRMAKKLEESKEVIDSLKEELSQLVSAKYTFADLVGINPQFQECIRIAKQAAHNISNVLITGESGTGKELFAQAIHNYGPRARGPFIRVNCAAIPDTLLESELFGYEKGAFTGAVKSKMGKFELAQGGTIFLDEIGDMNITLQAKLLRVIQEKEVERLGSNRTIKIDVRIIAATHHKLIKHAEQGNFRQDLYYRLNVIGIDIPPLRARNGDILLLTNDILQRMNRRYSKGCTIDPGTMELFLQYNWPGNVRELENILERAVILAEGKVIVPEHIQLYIKSAIPGEQEPDDIIPLPELEERMIKKALDKFGTSLSGKKKAARKLKISLATLYNKLNKYESDSKN